MKKILKITLMSDLCAAVGKNYAALIDTDTALDELGLPYIPSKRLKGCLREVAEFVGLAEEKIDSIFGISGNDVSGTLFLTDAKIENYEAFRSEILKEKLPYARVIDIFCSVRSETAIENDTAKDKSLRFIRVVNRLSPTDNKNLNFFAEITFPDEAFDDIAKLCKGLRNIGYHRNRGLGVVKCELKDCITYKNNDLNFDFAKTPDTMCRIDYKILLKSDLMLPGNDANSTLDYIPGTTVLGSLAGKYAGANFEKVFLSNRVRFENLYLVDDGGNKYVPSPRFFGKIKAATDVADKGVKNLIASRNVNDGKIIKPLKKGFVNVTQGYKDVAVKTTYHNSMQGNDKNLYTQDCICAGQTFKGSIIAPYEIMQELAPLLADNEMKFGRSKTAQYATCRIIWKKATLEKNNIKQIATNQTIAFVCESDVILTDENGIFTTELKELKNQLGLGYVADGDLGIETNISAKLITGYNAKWNLKKTQIPAISAGSCIVLDLPEDKEFSEYLYIGEKQNEGFGKIKLYNNVKELKVDNQKREAPISINESNSFLKDKINSIQLDDQIIKKAIDIVEMLDKDKQGNLKKDRNGKFMYRYLNINSSQIGRAMLMCKESKDRNDFNHRINSIKTDSVRNSLNYCFNDYCFKLHGKTNIANDWTKAQKLILTILTLKKYQLKGAGK